MARTATGERLTEGHRLAQSRNVGTLLNGLAREWDTDTATSSSGLRGFARDAAPVVLDASESGARTASNYFHRFRAAEGVPGSAPVVRPRELRSGRILDVIERRGPEYVAALIGRGLTEKAAVDRLFTQIALQLTRETLRGARDNLAEHIQADDRARGYMRVPGPSACAFCAMLSARGAVYSSERAAGGDSQWHPGCRCEVEPVFSGSGSGLSDLPKHAREYRDIWDEVDGSLNAFRRRLERPHLHASK